MTVLSIENFALWVADSGKRYILEPYQTFALERRGVYTLEGDNLSGKSTLIRTVMGATPKAVGTDAGSRVTVDDEVVSIRNVPDAFRAGLVAVFQDDHLIPTMTVWDQIVMRHGTPHASDWPSWLGTLAFEGLAHVVIFWTRRIGLKSRILLNDAAQRTTDRLRQRADELLKRYGGEFSTILDKYPHELSGGAIAVAKILNAQMSRNVRVLFLDEAFNGVQRDVKPHLIEIMKEWAADTGTSIVAVSHDREELLRWQPIERFVIRGRRVEKFGPAGYSWLEPAMPQRVDAFPVYEGNLSTETRWAEYLKPPFWMVADAHLKDTEPFGALLLQLKALDPSLDDEDISFVVAEEQQKTVDTYCRLISEGADALPLGGGTVVIVGGGITLNVGGFAAATLHRGRSPQVWVPTSSMAMADVAVGSKTGVNLFAARARTRKHVMGVYVTPSCVIIDNRFLNTLPPLQKKHGLVECLKHGLLQSRALFDSVVVALGEADPSADATYAMAIATLRLKSRLLATDPWEHDEARLLLYGHAHAHALEAATQLRVPHGVSVLWGILVELVLAGERLIYRALTKFEKDKWHLLAGYAVTDDVIAALSEAYQYSMVRRSNGASPPPIVFDALELSAIGQYSTGADLRVVTRSFDEVMEAWREVALDVSGRQPLPVPAVQGSAITEVPRGDARP
jgi:3-dehydroquinate synthetase/ABC-type dipeptide/oligopeptide/nickel transport system ATPase component